MFKLNGTLKVVNPTVQVSEKFSKREFVLTDSSSTYPQDILFQCTQKNCELLDMFASGQEVEVSFNLRGREWINPQGEAKYFNSLEAWKIETVGTTTTQTTSSTTAATVEEQGDELPF